MRLEDYKDSPRGIRRKEKGQNSPCCQQRHQQPSLPPLLDLLPSQTAWGREQCLEPQGKSKTKNNNNKTLTFPLTPPPREVQAKESLNSESDITEQHRRARVRQRGLETFPGWPPVTLWPWLPGVSVFSCIKWVTVLSYTVNENWEESAGRAKLICKRWQLPSGRLFKRGRAPQRRSG